MSLEENKELVRQFIEQVMNAGDASAIPGFMVPGSMFAGAFEGFVTKFRVSFPDFHLTIEDVFAEGDQVLVQTTMRATQMGLAFGHPPTGNPFLTTGI